MASTLEKLLYRDPFSISADAVDLDRSLATVRELELTELCAKLDKNNFIAITGEEGSGKEYCLTKVIEYAASRGYKVFYINALALPQSCEFDTLRYALNEDKRLVHALDGEYPNLMSISLIQEGSGLLFRHLGKDIDDPDLVISMLTAIEGFIEESFNKSAAPSNIIAGEFKIIAKQNGCVRLAATYDGLDNEDFETELQGAIDAFANKYEDLEAWGGSQSDFENIDIPELKNLFFKYRGIKPTLNINPEGYRLNLLPTLVSKIKEHYNNEKILIGIRNSSAADNSTKFALDYLTEHLENVHVICSTESITEMEFSASESNQTQISLSEINPAQICKLIEQFNPLINPAESKRLSIELAYMTEGNLLAISEILSCLNEFQFNWELFKKYYDTLEGSSALQKLLSDKLANIETDTALLSITETGPILSSSDLTLLNISESELEELLNKNILTRNEDSYFFTYSNLHKTCLEKFSEEFGPASKALAFAKEQRYFGDDSHLRELARTFAIAAETNPDDLELNSKAIDYIHRAAKQIGNYDIQTVNALFSEAVEKLSINMPDPVACAIELREEQSRILFNSEKYESCIEICDEILNLSEHDLEKTVTALCLQANSHTKLFNPKVEIAERALKLAREHNYQKGLAEAYFQVSISQLIMGLMTKDSDPREEFLEQALVNSESALILSKENNLEPFSIAKYLGNTAFCLFKSKQCDESAQIYPEVIALLEHAHLESRSRIEILGELAKQYNNFGSLFQAIGDENKKKKKYSLAAEDYSNASAQLEKAVDLQRKYWNNFLHLSIYLCNIAWCKRSKFLAEENLDEEDREDLELAEQYARESLKLADIIDHTDMRLYANNEIATCRTVLLNRDLSRAAELFNEASEGAKIQSKEDILRLEPILADALEKIKIQKNI